ncbi:MAG TPA: guanylate kinase [Clostridiales bacterium]|nr:guanylate kinase [Clostridiales bacterium]
MSKGQLFIVSGPSGSGKDTILKEVLARCPRLEFSISTITRAMRKGEVEGEKYHFITKDKFLRLLEQGEFLEYNEYMGNFYGTPKTPVKKCLESGNDMILEVDVNGAEKVRSQLPDVVSIFIMPPSLEVLKKRLSGRGTETQEAILGRLKTAISEIKRASEFDYIVVNDNLECAVDNLISIIKSERSKRERMYYIIDEVLKDVGSFNW